MMNKEIKRAYSSSDDYMLETANTLHSIFNDDIARFTAFDSSLDAAFSSDWLTKINLASTVVRDSQVKDILAQKTMSVIEVMEQCKLKYAEVKYFAKKTFPNNNAKQSEFGTDTYDDARKNQSRMISFMDEMHKACLKYSADLINIGMSQTQIDEIETLRTSLLVANTEQEGYVKGRPVLTQERIIALNSCFVDTMMVIEAAQIVYANDYARRNQFIFNPNGGSSSNPDPTPSDETIVAGIVRQDTINTPIGGANITLNTSAGTFPAVSTATGSFSITLPEGTSVDETANLMVISAGFVPYAQVLTIIPNTTLVFDVFLMPV